MGTIDIALLGGFSCVQSGEHLSLPLGAQRLVALLAMNRDGVDRANAGERLWPDSTRGRASANLRSALWRCNQTGGGLVDRAGRRLRLAPAVAVDLHEMMRRVHRCAGEPSRGPAGGGWESLVDGLGRELLPEWSDDWLMLERERWDQLRLHALEDLVQELLRREEYPHALQAALVAIAIEPTRETAHRLVIRTHLAEGNAATAVKHYQRYQRILSRELGVTPSQRMNQLIRPLLPP